jgi:hypothetical protein
MTTRMSSRGTISEQQSQLAISSVMMFTPLRFVERWCTSVDVMSTGYLQWTLQATTPPG